MKLGLAAKTDQQWAAFFRKYRAEMAAPAASQSLDVLAALSRHANFSVGCYCEDERAATGRSCGRCCLKEARKWSS